MLIINADLITWGSPNQILENRSLYIENDRIRDIGPTAELKTK
jgi:cytosine/adenosine deaminase-related metal-dependent hydrolase